MTLPRIDDVIQLPDKRQLAYAEYGEANGIPVFLFHILTAQNFQLPEEQKKHENTDHWQQGTKLTSDSVVNSFILVLSPVYPGLFHHGLEE